MNCDEARPLVDASVDRELSAADEWRLREHMAGCAQCRREAEAVEAVSRAARTAQYYRAPAGLSARIAAALPARTAQYYRAPAGLSARIAAALPPVAPDSASAAEVDARLDPNLDTDPRAPRPRTHERERGWRTWSWPRFATGGAGASRGSGGSGASGTVFGGQSAGFSWLAGALLVLCALGLAAALNMRRPPVDGAFVDELVASHVRAQISGRDIDVISTDRHTVKPWFNGKIDYAPPVEDLAGAGFPLVGGRLDYVGRERVAVLIYHYRKHVIDLYVFPQEAPSGHADAAPTVTADGYAVLRWRAAGMTWWAVTDAGPDALNGLRAALDARLGGGQSEG